MSLIKWIIRASGLTGAGGTLPFDPTPEQYAELQQWPMVRDPYAAEKDFHPIQRWLRWIKPAQIQAYRKYNTVRNNQTKAGQIDFQKYFETVPRPIQREKWEYLKLRKSWYIIVDWPRFAGADAKRILDCACGDGDVTQRLVDYVAGEWKRTGMGHELEVVGIDLGPSRIENAQRLTKAPDPRITMKFLTGNTVKEISYPDNYFDYAELTGVFAILDDVSADAMVKNLARVVRKGIYIEDPYDRHFGGFPRKHLATLFEKYGFRVEKRFICLQEPFSLFKIPDPCRVFSMGRIQNLWLVRD
jgi:ubiquinone/menaquinone biosynthesis C-methylase UbiE